MSATVQNRTDGNEEMLKEIVAQNGPISVVVSVTSYFQFYKNGVFYDSTCNSNCSSVNHAVVVVGYGTEEATNSSYWIVKNSWVCYLKQKVKLSQFESNYMFSRFDSVCLCLLT
jgi:C1A family cysteine protease